MTHTEHTPKCRCNSLNLVIRNLDIANTSFVYDEQMMANLDTIADAYLTQGISDCVCEVSVR